MASLTRLLPIAGVCALALSPTALAAPTTQIATPLEGQITNLTEIPVIASVSGDAACGRIRMDAPVGSDAVDVTPVGGELRATLPRVPEGEVTIRAYAWDAAGCVAKGTSDAGRDTVRVTVDRTAPADFALSDTRAECLRAIGGVALTSTGNPLVCWSSASDGLSGTAGYQVWVDGALRAQVASATRRVQLEGLAAGAHQVRLVAYDAAGNASASNALHTVVVDPLAPAVTWLQPAKTVTWVRKRVPLLARAADTGGAGMDQIVFSSRRPSAPGAIPSANLGRVYIPVGSSAGQRIYFDTTKVRDGRYEWTATAVDRAGNHRTVKRVVRVDNTSPRFSSRQRGLRVTGKGARRLLVKVSDVASPKVRTSILIRKGTRTVHRSSFILARDTDVQKITIPARVGSGRYRIQVSVKDLAGNMAVKSMPLVVRRG